MRGSLRALCGLVMTFASLSLPGRSPSDEVPAGKTLNVLVPNDESRIVERLANAGPLRSLKIQDRRGGAEPRIIPCERTVELDERLSDDGRFLAYMRSVSKDSFDTELCTIDLETRVVSRHKSEMALSYVFLPNSHELIVAEPEGFARLSAEGLRTLARYDSDEYEFYKFCPLPDGRHVAAVLEEIPDEPFSGEKEASPLIQLFRLSDLQPVGKPVRMPSRVASLAASPQGELVVVLDAEEETRARPNLFRRTNFLIETRSVPDLKVLDSFSIVPGQRHRGYYGVQAPIFVEEGRYLLWPHDCPMLIDWKEKRLVGIQPEIPAPSVFLPRARQVLTVDTAAGRLRPPVEFPDWERLFRARTGGPDADLLPVPSEPQRRRREKELRARQEVVDRFRKRARIDGDPAEWEELLEAAADWPDPYADWIPPELQPLSGRLAVDRGEVMTRISLRPFYLQELGILPGPEGFSILIRTEAAPNGERPNSYYLGLDLPYGDSEDLQILLSGSGRHRFFVNDLGKLKFPEEVPIEVAFGEAIEVYLPYDSIDRLLPDWDKAARSNPSAPFDCGITAFSMYRMPDVRTALSVIYQSPRRPARAAAK